MTSAKSTRLNNILLIALLVLMIAMIVLQAWHMIDNSRPVIRPHIIPKSTPKLPDAWYEKFGREQGMNVTPDTKISLVVQ